MPTEWTQSTEVVGARALMYSAGVPSSAVLELTTEMRRADSRYGKQLSEE